MTLSPHSYFKTLVESQNFIINKAFLKGLIIGLAVGSDRVVLIPLQYAAYTILLFQSNDDHIVENYIILQECFCIIIGLEIN